MAPKLSIIIPHKRTPLNDRALRLNLEMLQDNTFHDYELIIDTECPKDPYKIWNEASILARGEILVFTNSDVLMAPGWDIQMVENMHDNTIVTGYLVEPGTIGVASVNIHRDFGRAPETFRRWDFEDFCMKDAVSRPKCKAERGWYMPCAVLKDWFNWTGGFDTTLGFPNPNDILFWEKCLDAFATQLLRVTSYAYHFQNLSGR